MKEMNEWMPGIEEGSFFLHNFRLFWGHLFGGLLQSCS
jgi:hypothetical protein